MADRTATVKRDTLETQIKVEINLDGAVKANLIRVCHFWSIC